MATATRKKPATAARKKSAKQIAVEENRIGRPPLSPEGSVTMNIRLTPTQREKLDLYLGGVQWIRNAIDEAPIPAKPLAKPRTRAKASAAA